METIGIIVTGLMETTSIFIMGLSESIFAQIPPTIAAIVKAILGGA